VSESGWIGWGEDLPLCIDHVMTCWARRLRYELPWRTMLHDDVTGEMRRVVIELVNASWDYDDEARRHRLAAAARAHGIFRRAQRCEKSAVVCELTLMLDTIAQAWSSSYPSFPLVQAAIGNLLPDIRLARRAAERGFDGRTSERV
jgi:hypothetical protein